MIDTTFPYLASVGYTVCTHPRRLMRVQGLACLDCGATMATIKGGWVGGSLYFNRAPLATH